MNKKYWLIIIFVIVVALIGCYLFSRNHVNSQLQNSQINSTSTITSTTRYASFSYNNFFQGESAFKNGEQFINTSTKDIISFQLLTGPQYQSANPSFNVLVNKKLTQNIDPSGKQTDQAGGEGISLATFSPNNQYFAFRSRFDEGCAGGCEELVLYLVNIPKLQTYPIRLPIEQASSAPKEYQNILNFVASYSWGSNNDILITAYEVGNSKTGLYRFTPQETWDYNLISGSSTLISMTP